MKLTFTPDELGWLHTAINLHMLALAKHGEPLRHVTKMRYKFHGKPSYVSLTSKERGALASLAAYRVEMLEKRLLPSAELKLVRSILLKVA